MSYYYLPIENEKRKEYINRAIKSLEKIDFDTIVVRGVSGLLVGPAVAMEMDKELVIVRKPGENSHGSSIEGNNVTGRYVIIDDFVDTGNTVRTIIEAISKSHNASLVGVYQYGDGAVDGKSFDIRMNRVADAETKWVDYEPIYVFHDTQSAKYIHNIPQVEMENGNDN